MLSFDLSVRDGFVLVNLGGLVSMDAWGDVLPRIIDTRRTFINAYNPNDPQDVLDYRDDTIPWTYRNDEIHPRQNAAIWAAAMIRDFIAAKGW